MRCRALRLLRAAAVILAAGLLYAAFCTWSGWAIPCPFRLLTGWLCPGCGVTRMCLALLRLDLPAAWAANPGLLLLLLSMAVRYIRTGARLPTRREQAGIWCAVGYLLLLSLIHI